MVANQSMEYLNTAAPRQCAGLKFPSDAPGCFLVLVWEDKGVGL